jgi:ABC-type transporter MlaC component
MAIKKITTPNRFVASVLHRCCSSLVIICLSAYISMQPCSSNDGSEGQSVVEHLARLFTQWSGEDNQDIFKDAANSIDYQEMSERALGPYWAHLKPNEQADFIRNFQHLVEERYYKRWHRLFQSGKLNFVDEASSRLGDLTIRTNLSAGRKSESLTWHLCNKSGRYRVISLAAGQDDLLERVSDRLRRRLARGGLQRLLTWMKKASAPEDGNPTNGDDKI